MKIEYYKPRIIDEKLDLYLSTFGAVLIEGPKWCGKTWTGRHSANSEFLLSDPEGNFNNKRLAQMMPDLALDGACPRLIDEWQETPQIWDAVRGRVDSSGKKGAYILTGSATVDKNAYIHSGTGRIAHLRMRPMSSFESGFSDGKVSLLDICHGKAPNILVDEARLEPLIEAILIGGWPSSLGLDLKRGMLVAREYVKSVLSEDIYKIDGVKRDAHKIELLLRSLSRNEATTSTNKVLKNDIKDIDCEDVNIDSVTEYLNVLNRLYLLENIPPFSNKLRSSMRVKQSEKRHFVDPSLPCAILGLSKEKLLGDLELLGFLFESLVERDLLTYCDSFNGKLYHYQDYENNEIDAIIELEDGSWSGFEIKLGANKIDEAASNLIRINDRIIKKGGKGAASLCVIVGLSNACYKRKDGVYVVSIASLKN